MTDTVKETGWDWQELVADTPSPTPGAQVLGKSIRLGPERIPGKDIVWMFDKLATTQNAGLPLHQAVGMLARMRTGSVVGARLDEIQAKMSEGRSLSSTLRDREREFGPMTCALVEAGESSGSLERAFRRIADLMYSRISLRKKIVRAMMYPMVAVSICFVLVVVMLLVVIPQFEPLYADAGNSLPLITRVMVNVANAAPQGLLAMGALFGGFIALMAASKKNVDLRRHLEATRSHIPIIGSLMESTAIARMSATLANLLNAGVPLLLAVELAADTSQNVKLSDGLMQVRRAVGEGETFTAALQQAGAFPELFIQLSRVGEQSGSLPALMDRYASTTEKEVADATEALTTMIEPLMIVVIGAVVGVCLLGLYLPILNLGNQIK